MDDSFLKQVLCEICADCAPDEATAKKLLQNILEHLKKIVKKE